MIFATLAHPPWNHHHHTSLRWVTTHQHLWRGLCSPAPLSFLSFLELKIIKHVLIPLFFSFKRLYGGGRLHIN